MIKSKRLIFYVFISIAALSFVFAFLLMNGRVERAKAANIEISSLISTGSQEVPGQIEWAVTGSPLTWSCGIEEIKDSNQADGGDLILRNSYTGNKFDNSLAGCSRQNKVDSIAAYKMKGLTLKYYVSGNWEYELYFTENSGWYLSSNYHWSLDFVSKNKVSLRVGSRDYHTVVATADDINMNTDYDYFADKENEFNASKNVGTANIIQIMPFNSGMYVYINGSPVFNLTELGVIDDYVAPCVVSGQKMFFTIFKRDITGGALKITDFYNTDSFDDGTPFDDLGDFQYFQVIGDTPVFHFYDDKGFLYFLNGESGFHILRSAENGDGGVFSKDMTLKFLLKLLNNGDRMEINFIGQTDSSKSINIWIERKNATTARIITYVDFGQEPVFTECPFNFDGVNYNYLKFFKDIKYHLVINEKEITDSFTDTAKLDDTLSYYPVGGRFVYLDLCLVSDRETAFCPVRLISCDRNGVTSDDEYTVSGNVETINVDGACLFYNTADTPYSITYNTKILSADCFTVRFKYGKNGNKAKPLNIIAGNNDYNIKVRVEYVSDTRANVILSAKSGGVEKLIYSQETDFDYNYNGGEKSVEFCGIGTSSYIMLYRFYFFGTSDPAKESIKYTIDDSEKMENIEYATSGLTDKLTAITFNVEGDAYTMLSITDCLPYSENQTQIAWKGGWTQGLLQSAAFAQNPTGDPVIICDLGYSYLKSKPVLFDGFEIELITYSDKSNESPLIDISSTATSIEYSVGLRFLAKYDYDNPTKATFILYYCNTVEGEYSYITDDRIKGKIASFSVDWHWNDGQPNSVSLYKESGEWFVVVNDTVLDSAAVNYSGYIEELYNLFNTEYAYLQVCKGFNQVWHISSLITADSNSAPVVRVHPKLQESYRYGESVVIDLKKVFRDSDGDALTYSLGENARGTIEGTVWTFDIPASTADGVFYADIVCTDSKGKFCVLELAVNVNRYVAEIDGEKLGCIADFSAGNSIVIGLSLIASACVIFLKKKYAER